MVHGCCRGVPRTSQEQTRWWQKPGRTGHPSAKGTIWRLLASNLVCASFV